MNFPHFGNIDLAPPFSLMQLSKIIYSLCLEMKVLLAQVKIFLRTISPTVETVIYSYNKIGAIFLIGVTEKDLM